ncbi:hypothetical protein [Streptomyces sp. NPDC005423]|uniref:hypothetical protein n=1 Tax=Streptomyces sp. NPDC005423 TaxID=3155343 RepID=UPI0033B98A89
MTPPTGSRTPWSRIEDALRDRYVTDVLVPGRIDQDETVAGIARFVPQPLVVFVELDEGALRLESAGQYGRLDAELVDAVSLAGVDLFEAIAEEGDELALSSQGEQLFGDGWTRLRCTTVRPYPRPGAGLGPGDSALTCLALELESRHWLFFDPGWPFGIRIGNAEDMRRWEQDHADGGRPG